MRSRLKNDFKLIWSGQHYSDNLKEIFFRELEVEPPDIELAISGESDAQLTANMISRLSEVLVQIAPAATVFLGDTNTVMGSIAAAQLNIPIFHIEGCMRSYDWRMPEEKYRTVVDHLSDHIYAYTEPYKIQGIAEGIPASSITVTGNPIVEVLDEYFLSGKLRLTAVELNNLLSSNYDVGIRNYLVMTCHRRENVENVQSLKKIFELAARTEKKVLFFAGYRTQKMISNFKLELPPNLIMFDPIGYLELLELIYASYGVLTDSGTIVEEAAIIGVPTIQLRKSTERPQVYEFGASIKYDPLGSTSIDEVLLKIERIQSFKWQHTFGDGTASYKIAEDLCNRYLSKNFRGHIPSEYEPYSTISYQNDQI
jgi:UDP-N-acetylglucosamine 2-epimerase (non-hydrolysing)